jgi:beta-lactamase class A
MLTRRRYLTTAFSLAGCFVLERRSFGLPVDPRTTSFEAEIARLEKESGGRLGVALLDTATGSASGHRSDERFPMCSTHKLISVAAVLHRVDQHKEQLDRIVPYTKADLVAYSPATEKHTGEGMSVQDLCTAAITLSDNTAANLLLASLGGPAGWTAYIRTLGDTVTRLDRNEPTLNEATPGDPRDTTTPAAMLKDLHRLTLGDALSPSARTLLTNMLLANTTGGKRLRGGLPTDWKVGDKTGSGGHGSMNDVAILYPPSNRTTARSSASSAVPNSSAPLLAAVFLTETAADDEHRSATLMAVGHAIAASVS